MPLLKTIRLSLNGMDSTGAASAVERFYDGSGHRPSLFQAVVGVSEWREDEGEDGERGREAKDGRSVMRRVFALKRGSVVRDGDFGWWRGDREE